MTETLLNLLKLSITKRFFLTVHVEYKENHVGRGEKWGLVKLIYTVTLGVEGRGLLSVYV